MKRILLISLILVVMLLSACAAPVTTPEPTTTPTPALTPAETILTPTLTPTYTLSVSVSPSGAGSVSPPGGKYESGLHVTLTATPASGYTFDYWDGAASGSSSTVTITMNSNKSTTAHFKVVKTPATPTPSPTPTPTPTSTPTSTPSPGYSRSNPVGIGAPLNIKVNSTGGAGNEYEVRLTLLEVIRGTEAWQRILAQNQFNSPPKTGYEYILAKVRFEYLTGPTPDTSYRISSVWFNAVSAGGKDYDRVSVVEPSPSINTNLYPGASQEGWVSFCVAQDDAKPLMTFGRKYDGTGGIWFKLY